MSYAVLSSEDARPPILFTFLLFYLFTFKKQDFLTIKTRLLSRANKASFKSKEALFSIRIHLHLSAFVLRCQRINEKYY